MTASRGRRGNAHMIYLLDGHERRAVHLLNSTVGARIAVENLKDQVKWMRAMRGADVFPVVELSSAPMKTKMGTKIRPDFRVVEWRQLGDGESGPVTGAPPTTPAIGKPVPRCRAAKRLMTKSRSDLPDSPATDLSHGSQHDNSDCAARLAAAGLVVFPCDPQKRTPLFKGWRTLQHQRRRHRRRLVDAMAGRRAGARPGALRPGGARRRSAPPRRRRRRGAARAAEAAARPRHQGAADGEDAARRRARLLSAMPAGADQQPRQPAGRHRRARRRRLRDRARRDARQPAQLRADRRPARARRRVRRQDHS